MEAGAAAGVVAGAVIMEAGVALVGARGGTTTTAMDMVIHTKAIVVAGALVVGKGVWQGLAGGEVTQLGISSSQGQVGMAWAPVVVQANLALLLQLVVAEEGRPLGKGSSHIICPTLLLLGVLLLGMGTHIGSSSSSNIRSILQHSSRCM